MRGAQRHSGEAAQEVDRAETPPVPLPGCAAVLLYDGTCGFCASSVQWVLKRDRVGTLRFAALQGETARPILARHPELAGVDSVVWVDDTGGTGEEVLVRSAAALRAARYLEGKWSVVARLGALVPRRVRDWCYDLIARHRHQLTRNGPECLVPTAEEWGRFLP